MLDARKDGLGLCRALYCLALDRAAGDRLGAVKLKSNPLRLSLVGFVGVVLRAHSEGIAADRYRNNDKQGDQAF